MDDPIGAKEALSITKDFLSPVGETLSDVWKGIIGDRISHWRLRNAMALQKATNDEARRLGLTLRPEGIPERYAFAWFEEATKQDEPELQVLFARLLARAAAGEGQADDRRLIDLLKQMTPADAAVFQRVYSNKPFPGTGAYSDTGPIGTRGGFVRDKWPRDWMTALVEHFHPGEAEAAIESLIRIGCLGSTLIAEGERNRPPLPRSEYLDRVDWRKLIQGFSALRGYVAATELGRMLAAAVRE
jgi:hypothetical protein